MTRPAYIYDAVRTPRGKGKNGSLHEVKPVRLLTELLEALKQRNNLDTSRVDDAIIGCTGPVGEQGSDIARTAILAAGWNDIVSGIQVDRYCASALDAVALAATKIMCGWEDMMVAGGVESMSRVPMGSAGGPWADDPETNITTGFAPQGIGADLIATIEDFSREDLDTFALNSQKKAAAAQAAGHFDKSVIPVKDANGMIILEKDEFIRPDTTMEGLAKLRPSFKMMGDMGYDAVALARYPEVAAINHVHHAGNSSGIVDGASAVLIGSEKIGKELGLTPRGRLVSSAVIGVEPTIMLTGPAPASLKALKIAGLTLHDIDLFEVNEAFAAVPMRFQKDTGVPWEKINPNGGAIAMGHPLGATGAMLLSTVLDELERRDLRYGLCNMCAGAGIGIATIIERV
ncbi:MAG: acetyl-CoA C-acetyltransferase [Deltaproteobacteria bacterium]|nr:MAG: acetyl-CoA C-acetyltransferase [Deltaproteobacteria bacterium]